MKSRILRRSIGLFGFRLWNRVICVLVRHTMTAPQADGDLPMLDTAQPTSLEHIKPLPAELLEGDKIQPGHPLFGLIWINPKRVSGTPCFYGTRVPVKTLFDWLAAGETLQQFLDDFEGVEPEQAMAIVNLASRDLLSELESL
jgi:uncharacterized protein (DUF433 family)